MQQANPHPFAPWRKRLHEIIFEADTPAGKLFDLLPIVSILLSVAAVMLESITPFRAAYGPVLRAVEWGFTLPQVRHPAVAAGKPNF